MPFRLTRPRAAPLGQGLGPAVHQRFARAVAAIDPATVILGTISAKNTPSLRAALNSNRAQIHCCKPNLPSLVTASFGLA